MTDNFSKNFKWIIFLFGIIFLDFHLMTLKLEFKPNLKYILPFGDIFLMLLACYLINRKKNLLFIPLILLFVPLLVMTYTLQEQVLSEYFFWGHLIKTMFFLAFMNSYAKRNIAPGEKDNRFAFFFFLSLLILPNLFYVLCDFTPPSWDPTRHTRNVYHIFNMLFQDDRGLFAAYMHYDLYPSLSYILAIPFVLLFGKSNDSLVFSLIFFWLPLSFYYTKKIINEIFKISQEYSILISFIYHSNIIFLSYYKQFLLDFQPIVLLTVYYYYIWKSSFLNSKKYSIVAGLVFGLGFLSKQTFLLYAAPILIFIGGKTIWNTWLQLKSNHPQYLNRWTNLFLHLIFALALIVPWFGGWQFMYHAEIIQAPGIAQMEGDPHPHSLASVLWHFPWILYAYTWPFLLALALGWVYLVKLKRFYIHKYIAVLSILIIYVALTLNYNKDIRYISGILFYMSFGFCGLAYMNKKFASWIIGIFALLSFGYSIHLASRKKFAIPSLELTNYVLPYTPEPPTFHEEAGALAAFEKMIMEQPVPEEKKVLSYTRLKEDTYFNFVSLPAQRNMLGIRPPATYDSILHKGLNMSSELYRTDYTIVNGPSLDSGSLYLYGRDYMYPSYYLFAFKKEDTKGQLRLAGFEGDLQADIMISVNKFMGDSMVENQEGILNDNFPITIPPAITNLEIAIHIYHHRGRWQLIFLNKFTPYYNNHYHYSKVVPYTKDKNQNGNWLINFRK